LLASFGLSVRDKFFLYLGGINPHKNLVSLAECFAKLEQQDTKLVIIGDIKTESFTPGLTELRQRINELGIGDRVIFTGYISDEEAVHFLNVAKTVVLPSFAEGFGLPALEGAACGTPVIATRNSPLPDLLAGGGVFVDPEEPQQLLSAMQQIISDEQDRRHMAQTARQKAQKLTWENSAQQMQTMLSTIEKTKP
jgi:glycosyltransferase involved in cell wall biosynthesis